ncbi:MAG TPA: ADP-ribosylglycohydrolase family protein [Candidatus Acidoferrum sp.]|nr:ADP-ribosylglycohydrolase family protein [Candidatus Acidoferrum sp.]
MKAWQEEHTYMAGQRPLLNPDPDNEKRWQGAMEAIETGQDAMNRLLWDSSVPGSYAKERVIIGAIQSVENMGREVEGAERLTLRGLKALESGDTTELALVTYDVWAACRDAKKVNSPYWDYTVYESFEQYESAVWLPRPELVENYEARTYAGWLGQIIGGAFGTAMEGYTTDAIFETLGEVRDYPRKPNTYNDDITYELALLRALDENPAATSADIARMWNALIPSGWSAEDIALKNIARGILPPESGYFGNPYREWIGAQMRGAVCGMLHPGDAAKAAKLAWEDGCISHHNSGILGEIYNAVLVALSYVEADPRILLERTMDCIPQDSEYFAVVKFAMEACEKNTAWRTAWALCEERFKAYNWIHAYPNVAAQIVALWYGGADFEETMYIIGMCGQDVDCNAAQLMNAVAVMVGEAAIPEKWKSPIGDRLDTYVRGMKHMTISGLAKWTCEVKAKLG